MNKKLVLVVEDEEKQNQIEKQFYLQDSLLNKFFLLSKAYQKHKLDLFYNK